MPSFVLVDPTGLVVGVGSVPDADLPLQLIPEGCTRHVGKIARPFRDRLVGDLIEEVAEVPPTLDDRRANLLSRLATRRWEVETGGFAFRGKVVKSDADSQAKVNALMTGIALLGDSFHTKWKCQNGWLQLDAQGARELVTAGFAHVALCFAREGDLAAMIDAAAEEDLPSLAEAVEAFWP